MNAYFFSCRVCSDQGWSGELDDALKCPKCRRSPIQYWDDDGNLFCFRHRLPMTATYTTSAAFLFTEYSWRGHQHEFPNARLFTVGEVVEPSSPDALDFQYCEDCDTAYERWLAENADG